MQQAISFLDKRLLDSLNFQETEVILNQDRFFFRQEIEALDPVKFQDSIDELQHQYYINKYSQNAHTFENYISIFEWLKLPKYREYLLKYHVRRSKPFPIFNDLFWGLSSPIQDNILVNYDTTTANTMRFKTPQCVNEMYWESNRRILFDNQSEDLPDHPLIINLRNQKMLTPCDQMERYDFEVLQPNQRYGEDIVSPVQIIAPHCKELETPLRQRIHSSMKDSVILQEMYDDLSLQFKEQKLINNFLTHRDMSVAPADVDISTIDWFSGDAKLKRFNLFNKSELPIIEFLKTLGEIPELVRNTREELLEFWLDHHRLPAMIESKDKLKAMKLKDLNELYKRAGGVDDKTKKDKILYILEVGFETSNKWIAIKTNLVQQFNEIFPELTLRKLRDEFIKPSQEAMIDKLMSLPKGLSYELERKYDNMGFNLLDLIDIKSSDLKNMNLKDEDLIDLRQTLLDWAELPAYNPEMSTCYEHTSDSEVFETESEDINQDDLDGGDFAELSLEPDQKAAHIRDTDAFTYSQCGNQIRFPKKCSLNDAAIIKECRKVKTLDGLERFRHIRLSKLDGGWDVWQVLQDTVELISDRINS